MDQPHSLTLSLHHNLLKPEKGTHQPHSSTARLLGTAQTFREGDETPGTLRSPSGRSVSVVRQHLKSRDAPSQAHLDCIPHQASHEQKPNPGSLCGESPNNRTPGSCLSKSERRPRGREPEAVPQGPPPESRIDVWSVLGVPERTGIFARDICNQLSGIGHD